MFEKTKNLIKNHLNSSKKKVYADRLREETIQLFERLFWKNIFDSEDKSALKEIIINHEDEYNFLCQEVGASSNGNTYFLYMLYSYINLCFNLKKEPPTQAIETLMAGCNSVISGDCKDAIQAVDIVLVEKVKKLTLILKEEN
jgi:hypothetical protein